MPCRYYETSELAAMALDESRERESYLRSELDRLSALLCQACAAHEPEAGSALAEWWQTHKAADERARKRDAHNRLVEDMFASVRKAHR